MSSAARQKHNELMGWVDQLIDCHGRIQTGRGRRHKQEALHRAGVVLTVAAWEAYCEEVTKNAMAAIQPDGAAPGWAVITHRLAEVETNKRTAALNTPNRDNVRRLFQDSVGFDPFPIWRWQAGPKRWTEQQVRDRLDEWLRIRHCVAHGTALPANLAWLRDGGPPRLTLGLLKDCRNFFTTLVAVTDEALSRSLVAGYRIPPPW